MDMAILVPIFGIIFGCGIVLLAIWTEYKKDRALIEKGLYQPEKTEAAGPPAWGLLVAGSVLGSIGAALTVSVFVFRIGRAIGVPGFVFLSVGIALLVVHFVARKKETTPRG